MSLLLNAKDQEICCVYRVPVKLMPFSHSRRHGSGDSELSTAKDAALGNGLWGSKGLELCVYNGRDHGKCQAQAEGKSGSIPTCASLPLRELQPPFLLYLQ